ncbi:hypothetical protein [Streptomyces marincola]|uniref:hypothetical protein n=1 Tax=Streptomyces marincola TaxID=2878388 RepID=UPI001CF4795C|nr:hypothetical protein [Streptomyces marincola]UCM91049.1 hypothetical protein LC193_25595 [Streptomyces marincola]
MVRRPVAGEVHVHYHQIYVESTDEGIPGLDEAFGGQRGGLCGAASPGTLWLVTGLHTGGVGFTVEVHDQAPPLDAAWEDVVEVSFRPASALTALVQWAGEAVWDLGLEERDYRVRYCATGMDPARERDTRPAGEPLLDHYLLQFWPAPPAPDRVLKQTSAEAGYRHAFARRQPPPPTPAERAEAERRARLARERAEEEYRLARERWEWGGQLPSPALRGVGGNVRGLLPFDPGLVHAIGAAGPEAQRAVALLGARRACEAAGLAELDWVAEGLAALAGGRPLPPPFDDEDRLWRTLASDPRVPERTVGPAVPPERPPFRPPAPGPYDPAPRPQAGPGIVGPAAAWVAGLDLASRPKAAPRVVGPGGVRPSAPSPYDLAERPQPAPRAVRPGGERPSAPPDARARRQDGPVMYMAAYEPDARISQPHMALPALLAAAAGDPLRAAIDAVFAAVTAYGEDHPALLREIRSCCAEQATSAGPPREPA